MPASEDDAATSLLMAMLAHHLRDSNPSVSDNEVAWRVGRMRKRVEQVLNAGAGRGGGTRIADTTADERLQALVEEQKALVQKQQTVLENLQLQQAELSKQQMMLAQERAALQAQQQPGSLVQAAMHELWLQDQQLMVENGGEFDMSEREEEGPAQ
eukprot:3833566-Prymnesium_polylepis.1